MPVERMTPLPCSSATAPFFPTSFFSQLKRTFILIAHRLFFATVRVKPSTGVFRGLMELVRVISCLSCIFFFYLGAEVPSLALRVTASRAFNFPFFLSAPVSSMPLPFLWYFLSHLG